MSDMIRTVEELNALDGDLDVVTRQGETFKAWQLQETAGDYRNLTELFILPAALATDVDGGRDE